MHSSNNRGMRDWVIFIKVTEFGSLSKAAKALNISVAAVSKSIYRLESFVQASLIRRDRRCLELTCAGQVAYVGAKELTNAFFSLLDTLRNPDCAISGRVKFSAPSIICEFLANDWVMEYACQNPDAKIFLCSRERRDLSDNSPEFDDLVFKSGVIESEDLIHRRLNPIKLVLCASPVYLSGIDKITHPENIVSHLLLGFSHPWAGESIALESKNETFSVPLNSQLKFVTDNLFSMVNLAISSKGGIIVLPHWLADKYIKNKELELVLPEWKLPDMPVYLVWRHRRFYSSLFKDFAKFIECKWNALHQG